MTHNTHGVSTSVKTYISRPDFLSELCQEKAILHLGCSSGSHIRARLNRGTLLHATLASYARSLYGIDIDRASLDIMRNELGYDNLFEGDVQKLEEVPIDRTFDIVLAGDLLEHVTCPGAMLEGVKRFLDNPSGKFVISTNNAFGLHFQIRRWLGRYVEHIEHVCFYSPETLVNLFQRHGYKIEALYGAYTEPPTTMKQKLKFAVGVPLFKLFPHLAGTLVVVATPDEAAA
ncbi:class I SAM-dependent DNA methyltransferase [Thiohalobacter sp.]|uniref:class I SAM-dependent DNA methyltransferase n=1 Tax=Thiohalobacter sp. TaxID=2025948 RepID=UPI00261A3651|nr:methyltransferase domain-containing protein [Thiohalobacter sp.]